MYFSDKLEEALQKFDRDLLNQDIFIINQNVKTTKIDRLVTTKCNMKGTTW